MGSGERCKLLQRVRAEPGAKRYLVHFRLKMPLVSGILRAHSPTICLSLVCLQATLFGEARIGQHITPYNVMLHFVTVYTICYLLLGLSCGPVTTIQSNSKIGTPFLYALTLPNINQFSQLFHCQNQEKICNNTIIKDPTTLQMCPYTAL